MKTIKHILLALVLVSVLVASLAFSVYATEEEPVEPERTVVASGGSAANGAFATLYDDGVVEITPHPQASAGDYTLDLNGYFLNATGLLTVHKAEIKEIHVVNGTNESGEAVNFIEWKGHIQDFPELTAITFPSTLVHFSQYYSTFSGLPKLNTFGPTGTATGTCDLRTVCLNQFSYSSKFIGSDFKKVYLTDKYCSSHTAYQRIPSNFCENNVNLGFVYMGQQVRDFQYTADAFKGCPVKVVLLGNNQGKYTSKNDLKNSYFGEGTIVLGNEYGMTSGVFDSWKTTCTNYGYEFRNGGVLNNYIYWLDGTTLYTQVMPGETGEEIQLGAWDAWNSTTASNWEYFLKTYCTAITTHEILNASYCEKEITSVRGIISGGAINTVIFPDSVTHFTSRATGYGANGLYTFGKKSTVQTGVVDFTGLNYADNESYSKQSFAGGTFTSLVIAEGQTGIYQKQFMNNTALTTVTIPSTVTHIDTLAFSGCTNANLVINIDNFKELVTVAADAIPETATVVYLTSPESAIAEEDIGFQIRTTDYAGLRARFTVDLSKTNEGFTLVEYGTVAGSAAKFTGGAETVKIDAAGAVPQTIWSEADGWVGTVDSYDPGVSVTFYYTVTYKGDEAATYGGMELYMRAYQIWEAEDGTQLVIYTDYAGGKAVDLATTAAVSYVTNPNGYDDAVCWDVIALHNVLDTGVSPDADTATYYVIDAGSLGGVLVYRGYGDLFMPDGDSSTYSTILLHGIGGSFTYNETYFNRLAPDATVKVVNPEATESATGWTGLYV